MSFVNLKKKIDTQKIEDQYKDLKQFNVTDTLDTKLRVVKVADIPIGIASSDEDEKKLLEMLHHYGQNLTTKEAVVNAMLNMQNSVAIAEDLKEAEFMPENEVTINGETVFTIDGNLYDSNGKKLND